jgi:Zn-finger nucleic acid-binding protein
MQCPVDGSVLQMSERQGIEIDYCPQCRGVWLDRGELDKILERSERELPGPSPAPAPPLRRDEHYGGHRKRRKNFLEELFD